jgi:hypothetical protein
LLPHKPTPLRKPQPPLLPRLPLAPRRLARRSQTLLQANLCAGTKATVSEPTAKPITASTRYRKRGIFLWGRGNELPSEDKEVTAFEDRASFRGQGGLQPTNTGYCRRRSRSMIKNSDTASRSLQWSVPVLSTARIPTHKVAPALILLHQQRETSLKTMMSNFAHWSEASQPQMRRATYRYRRLACTKACACQHES